VGSLMYVSVRFADRKAIHTAAASIKSRITPCKKVIRRAPPAVESQSLNMQQFRNFRVDSQGHGSLRPNIIDQLLVLRGHAVTAF
jgi:hypothetical protein